MDNNNLADILWNHGYLFSQIIQGREKAATKLSRFFSYSKPVTQISSADALSLMQGRKTGSLRISFKLLEEAATSFPDEANTLITLKKPEKNQIDKILFARLRHIAEEEALHQCVEHLHTRLMTPPAGKKVILSLDTAMRGGVKVAIINPEGQLLDTTIVHLYPPLKDWYASLADLTKLIIKHRVDIIGIGVGPALRESSRLIQELMQMYPDIKLVKKIIAISAAPSFSASEMIDESFWTAVSIGRQVQNPLSELAKIAPHHLIAGTMSEEISPEKLKIAVETVIQECLHAPRKVQNTHRHQKEFHRPKPQKAPKTSVFNSAMADALAKLNIGATS